MSDADYDLIDITPDKLPGLAPPRPLHEPLRNRREMTQDGGTDA